MNGRNLFLGSLIGTCLLSLISCGIGGGGGGLSGGSNANVNIDAEPNVIDTGDRMQIALQIASITVDAIAIKVRFPLGLSYVEESAFYEIDGEDFETNPTENVADSSNQYLVFYLNSDGFPSGTGTLFFTLEATADVPDSPIEVDIDLDNPDVANSSEFSIDDPRFDAQDQDIIRVGDSSSGSSSSSSSTSSSSSSSSSG